MKTESTTNMNTSSETHKNRSRKLAGWWGYLKYFARKVNQWSQHNFVLLIIGSLITAYLGPRIIAWSDETKALREARVKLAYEFSDRNTEFNSKNNALATLMWQFQRQVQLDPGALKEHRLQFQKEYLTRRLALDEMAWWWYGNLETRSNSLKLTGEESQQLHADLQLYAKSVEETVNALMELSDYLRSDKFDVTKDSEGTYDKLWTKMSNEKARQHYFRKDLVIRIYALLAKGE